MEKNLSPKYIIILWAVILYIISPVTQAANHSAVPLGPENYAESCILGILTYIIPVLMIFCIAGAIYGLCARSAEDILTAFGSTAVVGLPLILLMFISEISEYIGIFIMLPSLLLLFVPSIPVLIFGLIGFGVHSIMQ